jgi:CobQ-like glutamine amidotransferase family enzyme
MKVSKEEKVMRIIKLLYLYPDLLNLYGDNGNIRILEKELACHVSVFVDRKSIGDDIDFMRYDFIYVGGGTERNQIAALKDLMRYQSQLSEYINAEKPILMSGNSFEMLGRSITVGNAEPVLGLGIVDMRTIVSTKKRDTMDAIYQFERPEGSYLAIGFINKASHVILGNNVQPLFKVLYGLGNCDEPLLKGYEGVSYHQLMGTHLTGPILVKNPWLLEQICCKILGQTGLAYVSAISENQHKAYKISLAELQRIADKK